VEKYLRRKLHLRPEESFQLTKKGSVGRLLYHLLRNPQQDRQYAVTTATYSGRFSVNVSNQLAWLNGCRHLTPQGVHDFNRQVEDLMEQEFHTKLDTLAEYGIEFEQKAEALRFLGGYGMTEDDYTLDALIKSYYRYRKAQRVGHERATAPLNIPICPAAPLALAA